LSALRQKPLKIFFS